MYLPQFTYTLKEKYSEHVTLLHYIIVDSLTRVCPCILEVAPRILQSCCCFLYTLCSSLSRPIGESHTISYFRSIVTTPRRDNYKTASSSSLVILATLTQCLCFFSRFLFINRCRNHCLPCCFGTLKYKKLHAVPAQAHTVNKNYPWSRICSYLLSTVVEVTAINIFRFCVRVVCM